VIRFADTAALPRRQREVSVRDIIDAIALRPKYCVWEVTSRCNMRCLHCASDLGDGRTRGSELTLEECRRVCGELKDLGCEHVVLSGGEAAPGRLGGHRP
jgi:molybdenum cofactor biosynthesis enzyme MoaA